MCAQATASPDKIPVAISACLAGQPVRYNGSSKRSDLIREHLTRYFELQPLCPEVGIGLGVPRPTLRLVGESPTDVQVLGTDDDQLIVTDALRQYARDQRPLLDQVCGYIFVKGSPSCGLERVKRYPHTGRSVAPLSDGRGVYADEVVRQHPLLPVEEDGRLNDPALCESFVSRVYVLHAWRQFREEPVTVHRLLSFYSRHKYLVMAHHYPSYQAIGRLLADPHQHPLETLADQMIHLLMNALKKPATRHSHSNVLHHLQGYLKRSLAAPERQELHQLIHDYREGIVPLIVPITLLKHHFRRHPDGYIDSQVFMNPYPDPLRLRNQL